MKYAKRLYYEPRPRKGCVRFEDMYNDLMRGVPRKIRQQAKDFRRRLRRGEVKVEVTPWVPGDPI